MIKYAVIIILLFNAACTALDEPVIICSPDAPPNVKLAAKEVRRYVYLRTGRLLKIVTDREDQSNLSDAGFTLTIDPSLEVQEYRLRSSGNNLTISGGSEIAVLYGAYAFAEKLGVRFYLHGDVIPDGKIPFAIPQLDETHKPIFNLRGVNPWGWHPQGIDAWSTDDYKALLTQLARLRMNFIGIHCYPEGHPLAEPTVWHGLPGDFDTTERCRTVIRLAISTPCILRKQRNTFQPKQVTLPLADQCCLTMMHGRRMYFVVTHRFHPAPKIATMCSTVWLISFMMHSHSPENWV